MNGRNALGLSRLSWISARTPSSTTGPAGRGASRARSGEVGDSAFDLRTRESDGMNVGGRPSSQDGEGASWLSQQQQRRQQQQQQQRCVLEKFRTRTAYRCADHSKLLLVGLSELRRNNSLYDITLRAEGRKICAHRVVLAASCDYFRGMFARGLREAQQDEVEIHGVTYVALERLVAYIYTAELEVSQDNVQDILSAAVLLQMSAAIDCCCDFLVSRVEAESVPDLYMLAEAYGLTDLADKLDAHLLSSFPAFCQTEAYRRLRVDKVQFLLSSDSLKVAAETDVYEAALLYHRGKTSGSKEEQEEDLKLLSNPPKVLECVRYELLSPRTVQDLYGRLNPCPLKEILADAMAYHANVMLQPVLQTARTRLRSKHHCVVGFGGMFSSDDNDLSDESHFLNPSTGRWEVLTRGGGGGGGSGVGGGAPPRMSNQGIAVVNNFLFLIGGDNNSHGFRAVADCWRYDPRHNKWMVIAALQRAHADHCVCAVGLYIYAIGGRDYVEELHSVERYSLETNTWDAAAPLPKEMYAHAGTACGGKVYVACGIRADTYLSTVYCYEPAGDAWRELPPAPVERAWHCAAALANQVYLIGGSNRLHGYRRDVLQVNVLQTDTEQWTSVAHLPAGHGEPGIAVVPASDGPATEGEIYIVGGRSHDRHARTSCVHVYDAATNSWSSGPKLEDEISGMACAALTLPVAVLARPYLRGPRRPTGPPGRGAAARHGRPFHPAHWEQRHRWSDSDSELSAAED
ncbi:kelch-like protein 22 [Lampetra planeri]